MGKHEGLYHGKTGTDGIVGKLALITMLSLDGDIAYCVIYFFLLSYSYHPTVYHCQFFGQSQKEPGLGKTLRGSLPFGLCLYNT